MEQSAWLQKKKTNRWIWILAACILTLGAVAVFLRNNPELFGAAVKTDHADSVARSVVHKESVSEQADPALGSNKHEDSTEHTGPVTHNESSTRAEPSTQAEPSHRSTVSGQGSAESDDVSVLSQKSISLPGINCKLRDRGDFVILVSIEVFYTDDHSRDELLTRREELKVMVRNVLSKKTLDQVQTEALRQDIKKSLNTVLTNAPVRDIQFKDFRIEKAKEK